MAAAPPAKLLKGVCRDHMHERCKYGDDCKFIHDNDLCFDFWKGKCSRGDKCEWNHFVKTSGGADAAVSKKKDHQPDNKPKNKRDAPAAAAAADGKKDGSTTAPKRVFETAKGGARGKRTGYGARNTESFTPSHEPPAMRMIVDVDPRTYVTPIQVRDVGSYPCIFKQKGDEKIYDLLVKELGDCSVPQADLLKSWHGDSHWIADDSTGWKKQCPTFTMVINRIKDYFGMDIKATRFNWYKDQSEWKPFHHDAAAVKPDKAKTQNFTVGVSFGCTRDAAFEDVASKTVISLPQPDGFVYTFARDVNIMWKHGILQVPPKQQKKEGRISIIAWGWVDQEEV